MESWLSGILSVSGRLRRQRRAAALVVLIGLCLALPAPCAGQVVSPAEREALIRLRQDRGGRSDEVDALLRRAEEVASQALPTEPITNKIREGLAKGADPQRIDAVLRQMIDSLRAADGLVGTLAPRATATDARAAVVLLAEALGANVTADEIRELNRAVQSGDAAALERVAGSAKGLALIKEARLPDADGRLVMTEAVRRGYGRADLLDLGREIKRREREFQSGRMSLRVVREAIARGDRPEQIFRDARVEPVTRPAATRPEAAGPTRPEPTRPERPPTPERPVVPERPTVPERPAR